MIIHTQIGKVALVGLVFTLLFSASCTSDSMPTTPETTLSKPATHAAPANMPPKNPYLADSTYPIGHVDSAQQDSVAQAGPMGPTQTLSDEDVVYTDSGPFQFGQYTSGEYENGHRVMWASGADRITKLDYDTQEVLDTYPLPGKPFYDVEQGEEIIDKLNTLPLPARFIYMVQDLVPMLMDLSGVYTVLDADNHFYVGGQVDDSGRQGITVYADADADDPDSPIEVKRQFTLPDEVTGSMIGMNMTYDGRIIVATEHGYVLALARDFSDYDAIRLRYSEEAPTDTPRGFGWVRNGSAIDEEGGIYLVSNDHMHKAIWTGEYLSIEEADGAWTEPYSNSRGLGSGATPALMGFGDEDKFVVITDGDVLMNVVLYWRDEIPEGWEQLDDAPSRRIAGFLPADMGPLKLDEVQTEQSVVVMGHGALVVNNEPRNVPGFMTAIDTRISALIVGFLGNDKRLQPYGIQKFSWDADAQKLEESWVNTEVSSLNGVPIVSQASDMIYTVGARDDVFTMEAIDWTTGESAFHWVLGDQRFNTLYSGVLLDENGRLHYTSLWGKVRLEPE